MCAISGIDMALLDLKGKVLNAPCYELLGGAYRKDILLYANYWFTKGKHNEEDYAAQARIVKEAGFTGLKFDPFAHTNYFYGEDLASNLTLTPAQQDLAFNVSKAVREAVGPEMDIMIETHAMLNYRIAVKWRNVWLSWISLGMKNRQVLRVHKLCGLCVSVFPQM